MIVEYVQVLVLTMKLIVIKIVLESAQTKLDLEQNQMIAEYAQVD